MNLISKIKNFIFNSEWIEMIGFNNATNSKYIMRFNKNTYIKTRKPNSLMFRNIKARYIEEGDDVIVHEGVASNMVIGVININKNKDNPIEIWRI